MKIWCALFLTAGAAMAVEWKNYKPNIDLANLRTKVASIPERVQQGIPIALPKGIHTVIPRLFPNGLHVRMPKMPNGLTEQLSGRMDAMLAEDIATADIRLLVKDSNKNPETHPLLEEAEMTRDEAISIFQSNWDDYYYWAADQDTEYRRVAELGDLLKSNNYNRSLSTLLILHDRCGNAREPSVLKILEALKRRNFDVNYNILLLDFKRLMCKALSTGSLYKVGFNPQLQVLASAMGEGLLEAMEEGLLKTNQTHVLGLGMSTHLAGLLAETVHGLTGQRIASILGLDPPVRLLKNANISAHVERFHVYHTYHLVPGLGYGLGIATTDFVFDGARRRPECSSVSGFQNKGCHVVFGIQLFISTLLFPKTFPARWCPDFQKFAAHFCDSNDYTHVSFPPDSRSQGIYQLQLGESFPYGMGAAGIFMTEEPAKDSDKEDDLAAVDVSKLSDVEYGHHLERELARMRVAMLSCMKGARSPQVAIKCVLDSQGSVKRLVDRGFIKREDCEPHKMSPTGKVCDYSTRTGQQFKLPF